MRSIWRCRKTDAKALARFIQGKKTGPDGAANTAQPLTINHCLGVNKWLSKL